ncbi:MAG: cupredoxin domain-containing protein [bacterium]
MFFAAALLHIPGAAVQATTFTVTANSNLTFTPSALTINTGDTVVFMNAGGNHNVVAADNSFTNGAPSTANWSFSHTFNSAGMIGYFCSIHGGPGSGMHGTITVKSVAPPPPTIARGGYMSGNWFNPDQSGQGFELEFTGQPSDTPGQNALVAYWYVYTPDGTGQNWIFAEGPYDSTSNSVTLPALLLSGAKFPPLFNSADLTQTNWGTLTFSFTDCNNGTASWSSSVAGYGSGSLPITRLTNVAGTACPAQ